MADTNIIPEELAALPLMITEKKLAELLNLSVSKIRKDRARKKGVPPCKIDRSVRYRRDDIIRYLRSLH